jgi:hypothetical protein
MLEKSAFVLLVYGWSLEGAVRALAGHVSSVSESYHGEELN